MEINSIKNINFFHSRSKVEQEIFIKKKTDKNMFQ